jgi:aspartate kinase
MIVEARARQDTEANITVGVQRTHLEAARQALEAARESVPMARIETDANTAQVAVVGFGISGRPDIARIFFQTLSARGVAVRAVSSSQMRLSALIDREYAELAARALHTAFGLDAAMDSRG